MSTSRRARTTAFPPRCNVSAVLATRKQLLPAIDTLIASLITKVKAWDDIVKIGRTHTQDATPLTLGQEFSGYVGQLKAARMRIERVMESNLTQLAIGGTAVGTGLNAPGGWAEDMCAAISDITGETFTPGTQQVHRARRQGRTGVLSRRAERARRGAQQDRQRHPLSWLRPALWAGRAQFARQRAGQLDHAGQGQPPPSARC